jgi:hypothetical protein
MIDRSIQKISSARTAAVTPDLRRYAVAADANARGPTIHHRPGAPARAANGGTLRKGLVTLRLGITVIA